MQINNRKQMGWCIVAGTTTCSAVYIYTAEEPVFVGGRTNNLTCTCCSVEGYTHTHRSILRHNPAPMDGGTLLSRLFTCRLPRAPPYTRCIPPFFYVHIHFLSLVFSCARYRNPGAHCCTESNIGFPFSFFIILTRCLLYTIYNDLCSDGWCIFKVGDFSVFLQAVSHRGKIEA